MTTPTDLGSGPGSGLGPGVAAHSPRGAQILLAEPRRARGGRLPVHERLRQDIARALTEIASATLGQPVEVQVSSVRQVLLSDCLDLPPDDGIGILFHARRSKAQGGLMAMDSQMVDGLVALMTGALPDFAPLSQPAPGASLRPPSAVDIGLMRLLTGRLMARLGDMLNARAAGSRPGDFQCASAVSTRRALAAALPDQRALVFGIVLLPEMGTAPCPGRLTLALPASLADLLSLPGTTANDLAPPDHPGTDPADSLWQPRMERAVLAARLQARCVIERIRMPAAQLMRLAPGDVLRLPDVELSETRLELALRGQPPLLLARGILGRYRQNKVLKTTEAFPGRASTDWHPVADTLPSPGSPDQSSTPPGAGT